MSVLIYFCVFHKFQWDSRFLHKIPGYFQGSRSQNKFQAFQSFQGAIGIVMVAFITNPPPSIHLYTIPIYTIWVVITLGLARICIWMNYYLYVNYL